MPDYELLDDEIPMTADDGVSPIDSHNKYFFLDFKGLKRNHTRFLNFYKHSNLFDVDLPHYSREDVYNKKPSFYKQSFDEFGHTIRIVEIPACIKIEEDPTLMALMATSDPNVYRFPSSINSTQYNNLMNSGKLLTNVIYQISKDSTETTVTTSDGKTFTNAINAYHEFIISSITYNSNTGMYDLVWEMLGGSEDKSNITVDSAIDSTSTNPVENRAIYNEIGNIQAILATLTTP